MKSKTIKFLFIFLIVIILIFNTYSNRFGTILTAYIHGLEATKFYHLIKAESSFRCFAYSHRKAIGLGQIKTQTSRYIEPKVHPVFLWIPPVNLHISAKYIKYLLKKYNNNWSVALAAYNWGETNVDKRMRNIKIQKNRDYRNKFKDIKETYNYIEKILDHK